MTTISLIITQTNSLPFVQTIEGDASDITIDRLNYLLSQTEHNIYCRFMDPSDALSHSVNIIEQERFINVQLMGGTKRSPQTLINIILTTSSPQQ